jgi:pyridoxine 5-phosphate synthase
MPKLGVNIDHVATIRQARKTVEPDPVWAAMLAELGGADQITVHLREDRRHIQDRDLEVLRRTVNVPLNLECAVEDSMLAIAIKTKPDQVCLVPEKRQEVTTEGGLDVAGNLSAVARATQMLTQAGIAVSLFIDPNPKQIEAASKTGATIVELHTGSYAHAFRSADETRRLAEIKSAAKDAKGRGLRVDAGHGLTYNNVGPIASITEISELNIGHSIISRAVLVGMERAVREMKTLVAGANEAS